MEDFSAEYCHNSFYIPTQGWFHGHGAFYTIDKMRFEGEFRGGRIWGNGLITYPDETPGIEGYFQDAR